MPVLCLLYDAPNDEDWEEPETEIYPWEDHDKIAYHLANDGCDIDSKFEDARAEICDVVKNHDSSSNR